MFGWLRELLEIKYQFAERKREVKTCESCEILKSQLHYVNLQNADMLNRLVNPPAAPEIKVDTQELKPISRHAIPWKTRQQMLEAEDREKARSMKNAAQPDSFELDELEKELGIVEGK